jgi:haloalkane dehalogenase
MRRAYISSGNGQVHYRESGSPDGPPVALLHQSPCSSIMYERLMSLLPQHLRVVAPDTPGFGASSDIQGELSIEAFAEVLQDALRRIDHRPWHVFGHHTGSIVAMAIAQAGRLPLASLTLSGPPCLDDELRALLTSLYQSSAESPDVAEFLQTGWDRIRSAAEDVPDELLLRDFAQGLLVKDLPGVYRAAMRFDPLAAVRTVTIPAMILAGERDPIKRGFPMIREAMPHARYISIEDGGIQMCELQAPEISAHLASFIAELVAVSPIRSG